MLNSILIYYNIKIRYEIYAIAREQANRRMRENEKIRMYGG